jgi:hypothetical protein
MKMDPQPHSDHSICMQDQYRQHCTIKVRKQIGDMRFHGCAFALIFFTSDQDNQMSISFSDVITKLSYRLRWILIPFFCFAILILSPYLREVLQTNAHPGSMHSRYNGIEANFPDRTAEFQGDTHDKHIRPYHNILVL